MTMTKVLALKTKKRRGKVVPNVVMMTHLTHLLVVSTPHLTSMCFLLSFGHNVNKSDVNKTRTTSLLQKRNPYPYHVLLVPTRPLKIGQSTPPPPRHGGRGQDQS